jgi:hypothetical protein
MPQLRFVERRVFMTALQRYDTAEMAAWARYYITARPEPDFTVLDRERKPYLQRWYIIPRNDVCNVYLHRFLGSDEDRALHDHRGDNRSWLLDGEYLEHLEDGSSTTRFTGEVVERKATDLHRVELVSGPVLSLFFIGPIIRDWGFRCPQGFVPWQDFVEIIPGGNAAGRGCG